MKRDPLEKSLNEYMYKDVINEMKARKVRLYRKAVQQRVISNTLYIVGVALAVGMLYALVVGTMIIFPD